NHPSWSVASVSTSLVTAGCGTRAASHALQHSSALGGCQRSDTRQRTTVVKRQLPLHADGPERDGHRWAPTRPSPAVGCNDIATAAVPTFLLTPRQRPSSPVYLEQMFKVGAVRRPPHPQVPQGESRGLVVSKPGPDPTQPERRLDRATVCA